MIETLLIVIVILLASISLQLQWIKRALVLPTPEPAPPQPVNVPPIETAARVPAPDPADHQILEWSDDGNHRVLSTVPHLNGITQEIKDALRDPSRAVRWSHSGLIERGQA